MQSEYSITQKVDFVNSSFQPTQETFVPSESLFSLSASLFVPLPPTLIKHLLCLRYELEAGVEGEGKTTVPANLHVLPLR